jgi:microcin C transport system permease protein
LKLSQVTRRRLAIFRANRRGYWSLWIFLVLFGASLFGRVHRQRPAVADPLQWAWYFPVLKDYSGDDFGADFLPTEADYTDPDLRHAINAKGWMIWPLLPYHYDTTVKDLTFRRRRRRTGTILGTDDQARDVLARVIYGFRLSVLFGFTLTALTSVVGVIAGALQGFYGGLTDLLFQRFIEIWSGMPELYMLIILGSSSRRLLGVADLSAAVPLDEPDRRGAGGVPARPQPGICAGGEGLGRVGHHRDVASYSAERDGGDVDVRAVLLSGSVTLLSTWIFWALVCRRDRRRWASWLRRRKSNLQAPWLGITAFVVLGWRADAADLHWRGGARRVRSQAIAEPMSLLEVNGLTVAFGERRVVDDVSFTLDRGETLALVGESGSGKSLTALSLLQLLPAGGSNPGARSVGRAGDDRGAEASCIARAAIAGIVFQEPMTSLNPLHRIGRQVAEAILLHRRCLARRCGRIVSVLNEAGFRGRRAAGWMRFRINCPAASGSG